MLAMNKHQDAQLIADLGGPAKVAALLNLPKNGGVQRVHNWMRRGIPAKVKIDHQDIFLERKEAA